jgi:hypothetical protein
MSYTVKIPNGLITFCNADFKCPVCECPHTEDDYYKTIQKSKHGLIYKQCKGCKTKLGITYDMRGDVVVWEKSTEIKHRK